MLSQLRSTMRDASFHGFESARYVFGTILSMLEDRALTWADQFQMAEERRSTLIARGSATREAPPRDPHGGHVLLLYYHGDAPLNKLVHIKVRAAGVLVPGVPTHAERPTVVQAPGAPDLAFTTTMGSVRSAPTTLPTALCGNMCAAGAGP
jgi:hypothetical protein